VASRRLGAKATLPLAEAALSLPDRTMLIIEMNGPSLARIIILADGSHQKNAQRRPDSSC
jgi:hypothetical protein